MFLSENYPYHGIGKWVDKRAGIFWRSDKRNVGYACRKTFDTWIDMATPFGKFMTIWGYKTSDDEAKNLEEPYAGFYMDIDNSNIDVAYSVAKKVYNYFRDIYKLNHGQVVVAFSGKKGFHIEVDPVALGIRKGHPELPYFYKWFARQLEFRLKLPEKCVDYKVYEPKRQWRCEKTRHEDGGLWCHRLSEEVFKSLDATLLYCTKEQYYPRFLKTTQVNPMAASLFTAERVNYKTLLKTKRQQPKLRKQNIDPNRLPYCIVSCMSKEPEVGERNSTLYCVARALYSIYQIDHDEIESLLLNWMPDMSDNEKSNTIRSAVQSDIPFSCMATTMMGDMLHKGIAECPFSDDGERRAFCDVYAGKPLTNYRNVGKKEISEYLDQLYAALDTARVRADYQQARIVMQNILEYEEKWKKEWEESVK